jgi:apolipoprotein N-acyltransferase
MAALSRSIGWLGQPLLVLMSVALLTPAFAPMDQSYLAWVGLVPWLLMIQRCRSQR